MTIHHVVVYQEDDTMQMCVDLYHDLAAATEFHSALMKGWEWHQNSDSKFAVPSLFKPTLTSTEIECFDNREQHPDYRIEEDLPFVRHSIIVAGVEASMCHQGFEEI